MITKKDSSKFFKSPTIISYRIPEKQSIHRFNTFSFKQYQYNEVVGYRERLRRDLY